MSDVIFNRLHVMISYLTVYISVVQDVRLSFFKPVAQVFQESLQLMATQGEWELIDLLGEKPEHLYEDGGWDELIVHVRCIFK